nr:hydrogenase maturation protease [Candidatus Njordarchaeum guaymaensis]
MKRTVVIGIGNILLGDDGVGVHVINRLRSETLPAEVKLIEGGVGGLSLLNFIRGVERAVFIDAVAGDNPGRIHRFSESDLDSKVKSLLHPASLHDVGLAETIKIGKSVYPDEIPDQIIVYGVEVKEPKEFSTELSKEVSDSVDKVVKLILDELKVN